MSLVIQGISKKFKDLEALQPFDLELDQGKTAALLGPNGAGKSTAVKIMATLVQPDGGKFLWDGKDLFKKPAEIRDLLGYVSQEMAMDKDMTAVEFIRFNAGLFHLPWRSVRERALALLKKVGLEAAQDRTVATYSGGMKRRLDLACALLHQPKLLILDEPTNGLDLEARELIWALVREFLTNGGRLILVSHDFRETSELADEVLIMDKGRVQLRGSTQTLKSKLGSWILRVKTHEFMTTETITAAKKALAHWPGLQWHPEEDAACFALQSADTLNQVQSKTFEALQAAGLPVFSVNVQQPNLEDVYRFVQRGRE